MGWNSGLPANATADDRTEFTVGTAREAARNSRVYAGSLEKHGAGALTLTGNNSYTGGTHLYGGSLIGRSAFAFGTGDMVVHGGTLAGSTTIGGSLLNEGGLLSPGENGFGTLGVLGSFAQFAAGRLGIEMGNGGMDRLLIGGTAFFGGTLDVSFLDGFNGTGLYTLVSTDDYLGRFSSVNFSGLSSTLTASLVYSADGVQLNVTAVPEPETYALMLAGLALVGWLKRRRRD
jgi:autotransporter-associated beta strand protein